MPGRNTRRLPIALITFFLVLVVLYATRANWLPSLARVLVFSEKPQRSDIIVVLGGDFRGSRIMAAVALMEQGYAPQALISGSGNLYGYHESDLAVDYALRHGGKANTFVKFPYPANSTREEAHAVIQELRRMHVHKVLVVTSNFHTHRAVRIFRAEAPDMEVHISSAGDSSFPIDGWWHAREGRKIFFDEWLKTFAYDAGL